MVYKIWKKGKLSLKPTSGRESNKIIGLKKEITPRTRMEINTIEW